MSAPRKSCRFSAAVVERGKFTRIRHLPDGRAYGRPGADVIVAAAFEARRAHGQFFCRIEATARLPGRNGVHRRRLVATPAIH